MQHESAEWPALLTASAALTDWVNMMYKKFGAMPSLHCHCALEASLPGNMAYCYAELDSSSIAEATVIASTYSKSSHHLVIHKQCCNMSPFILSLLL